MEGHRDTWNQEGTSPKPSEWARVTKAGVWVGLGQGLRARNPKGVSIPVSWVRWDVSQDGHGGFPDDRTISATAVGGPQLERKHLI